MYALYYRGMVYSTPNYLKVIALAVLTSDYRNW